VGGGVIESTHSGHQMNANVPSGTNGNGGFGSSGLGIDALTKQYSAMPDHRRSTVQRKGAQKTQDRDLQGDVESKSFFYCCYSKKHSLRRMGAYHYTV